MASRTTDAQRITLLLAETEVKTIEILIEYANLSQVALDRLQDALDRIKEALTEYRRTLQ